MHTGSIHSAQEQVVFELAVEFPGDSVPLLGAERIAIVTVHRLTFWPIRFFLQAGFAAPEDQRP